MRKPKPTRLAKVASFEGTLCPCGGAKARDTMLCSECVTHFTQKRPSLFDYLDGSLPLDYRRSSAVILVTLARKRTAMAQRGLPLNFTVA